MPDQPSQSTPDPASEALKERLRRHEGRIEMLEQSLSACSASTDSEVYQALGQLTMEIGRQLENLHERKTCADSLRSEKLNETALYCARAIDQLEKRVCEAEALAWDDETDRRHQNLVGQVDDLRAHVYQELCAMQNEAAGALPNKLASTLAALSLTEGCALPAPSFN